MTDNTDLLGGDTVMLPVSTPKRRGRPPVVKTIVEQAPVVPASTNATEVEIPSDVVVDTVGDGLTGFRPVQEADGSVSLELPPVSPEYAAAQANRPIIIGQTNREYAYKRLMRAGKKL